MKSKRYFTAILVTILFLIYNNSNSQTPNWIWARSFGGTGNDVSQAVAVDDSGNVYTTGTFENTVDFDPGPGVFNLTGAGILDIFILKLDSAGNFVWAQAIGGSGSDAGYAITTDPSGNVYVTGRFNGTVDFDPGAGTASLTSAGYMDIFITKFNGSGNYLWAKAMGGTGDDESFSIALDSALNIYTTGYFDATADFDPDSGTYNISPKGGYDVFISKLENSGNFIWAVALGGIFFDNGGAIALDAAANVYVTGHFNATADLDPGSGIFNVTSAGGDDIFVLKLDAAGTFVWGKTMGGNQTDWGLAEAVDPSGNVYSTGNFRGTADFDPDAGIDTLASVGDHDIFITRLNSNGSLAWAGSMGGTKPDYGYAIAIDALNNIYLTGLFQGTVDFDPGPGVFNLMSVGNNDGFISKFDSAGTFLWAKLIGGQFADNGVSLCIDHLNHLIIAGYFSSPKLIFGSDTLINPTILGATADIFIAKLDSGISTVGIENITNGSAILLYPNPVHEKLIINLPKSVNNNVTITISGISGNVIFKIHTIATDNNRSQKTEVNTKNFAAGVYVVKIQTSDFVETRKFIVAK